jgi:predicted RNA-binding protein Jag
MANKEITSEGRNVGEAVRKAAEELGVAAEQVRHKLDLSHFRNEEGRTRPMDTVKIIAWAADPSDSEGAVAAKAWLEGLIKEMQLTGNIKTSITGDKRALITIDSSDARFLVGRGGSTLNAIRALLRTTMATDFADWQFAIDVDGGERRDRDDRGDRGDRDRDDRGGRGRDDRGGRDREDRGDRGGRGRDDRGGRGRDDRGGRGRDDGGGRGRDDRGGRDREDRGDRRSERDVEDLKRLARKLAERVADEGGEEILRKPLNSFERRLVHMEVADMAGVDTATIEIDGERKVRIFAADQAGVEA